MQNISAKDFYKETKYNPETKNQIWLSQIQDSHDNFCNCWHPFAHLLASIFPPGHKDRLLTIDQILERDYTERCLSGGAAEENSGEVAGAAEDSGEQRDADPDYIKDEELSELIAAANAAADER